MLLLFFLCNLICVPLIYGTNITSKLEHNITSTSSTFAPKDSRKVILENNHTKETLVSEGGVLIENTPSLTLLKDNHTISLVGNDSSLVSSNSKVVPRKGVVFNENATVNLVPQDKMNQHTDLVEKAVEKSDQAADTVKAPLTKNDFKVNSTQPKPVTKVEVHKKPLVLSYETMATKDQGTQNDQLHIPAIKSSSKTFVPDQLPSPTNENGPTTKVHPMSASRHPGMVMPVVITILVVPMFAVLGYMALRRGQEAWKNRHYKRMDFLLDGMYND